MADPTERLVRRTRRRLWVLTLVLIAALVVAIGVVTAVAGLGALDADVDRALQSAATAAVAHAETEPPTPQEGAEAEEAPAASDTFILYLDATGGLIADPSRIVLPGLPDTAAVAAARTGGRDLRTVQAGSVPVRLLTLPVSAVAGSAVAYVQAGFVLTLHDRQATSLVTTIALVGGLGLLGAGLVTLLVTGRALTPIRRTLEAQRRFVADASHELRTPTAIIHATAEVLEREGLVAPGGKPLVADLVAETDRLGRLVGDLLTLAATEASPLILQRAPVDLAGIARDTVRRAQPLAMERQVDLAVEASGPGRVLGDQDRLVQLLLILVDNALDHSPAGGRVDLRVSPAGRQVELEVSDQGPGIPAAARETIFEAFTQLPGRERRGTGGSGLGLAIARRIVEAHEGTIRAADAAGGGAAFVVRLPAAAAEAPGGSA